MVLLSRRRRTTCILLIRRREKLEDTGMIRKRAKDGYQSIVEFKAAVFNRWGQKLYSWTDVSKGWNGRINGHLVNDGVYFLVVNAKGADGRKYNIRKAITVITGYNKDSQNSTTGGGSGG